ncbi:hypothetical protein C0993_008197 [Termitomyces sp. T159_Od127]|nr:hypothetical protein C0993_008197 [Termitomyces sp. T159_Od127]
MWTLIGPFDGETGDVSIQKPKLLKTGKTYSLGRKGCPLIVSNKKISSHHCNFEVQEFSADEAGDPLKVPVLKFTNMKDKPLRVAREGAQFNVNTQETFDLKDGDKVGLISGLNVDVKWEPMCCYVQPVMGKSPISIAECASLGLHVVHIPNPHVTHHIVPSYAAQPIIAASLLSASQFVKLEWLIEVLRLGTLPKSSQDSLESHFELPPLSKYRPAYSPSLPTSQKEIRVWEPNEERLNMLSTYRFLYVDEKNRIGDYKEVIERGGGSFEIFEAAAGKLKFHRALTRGQAKEGKTQVVVGRTKSLIAAVGRESWKELVEEAKSFGLPIVDPDVIVQVVIDVDTSLFNNPPSPDLDDEELAQSTSLPDFIPNTHSQEPSIPEPEPERRTGPPKRLLRRATSRQPSQEPSVPPTKTPDTEAEPEPEAAPIRRKALTRRVKAGGAPLVIGFDDPSMILDAPPDVSVSTPASEPSPPPRPTEDEPPPARPPRSSRLKRRVGALAESGSSQALGFTFEEPIVESVEEPPLKRFKALFEASGRENIDSGTFDDTTSGEVVHSQSIMDYSQTQNESQTQGKKSRIGRTGTANLTTLREEEEESQVSAVVPRGTKRGLEDVDEDVEMGNVASEHRPNSSKKRAIENVNAVEKVTGTAATSGVRATSKPPSSAAATNKPASAHKGAPPGKPDTDDKFLKAIASTKKGKKGEDDFDRDFNKLKINKPALERADPEEEWAVVADFGDDTNVRGNFMVVVEMPVYNRGRKGQAGEILPQWEGKPNFKKFKEKVKNVRSARVELVVNDENDYGMGPAYWKAGKSQNRHQDEYGLTQTSGATRDEPMQTQPSRSQVPMVLDDSDNDIAPIAPIRRGKSKASSRASSAVPPKRTSTRTRASAKSQPLFLEDDEDEDDVHVETNENGAPENSDEEQTLQSTRTTRSTRKPPAKAKTSRKKIVPILLDDDSDDGAVFKGFKT